MLGGLDLLAPLVRRRTATRLGRGVVTVTGNTGRVFPFQTLLPSRDTGLRVDSRAQGGQVHSVTVERIGPVVARLPPALLAEPDDALRLHLQL